MGFIKAFQGAIGGMFADQWLDFLVPPANLPPTAALFPAVTKSTNAGRGSNTQGSENVITNGSKIVVPEGYGLLTFQDGQLTGFIAEPGGYTYSSDNQQSHSVFAGDGFVSPTVMSSWERFKYGGQPAVQQLMPAWFCALSCSPPGAASPLGAQCVSASVRSSESALA